MSMQPAKKLTWRYREMRRAEKCSLIIKALLALSFQCTSIAMLLAFEVPVKVIAPWAGKEGAATLTHLLIGLGVPGLVGTFIGMFLLLTQARPSRTVLAVVEDRMEIECKKFARELEFLREGDAREMEKWKAETIGELYEMVIDQVQRGVIDCGKCVEIASIRRSNASESLDSVGNSGICVCRGVASFQVAYLPPPRRQSNATAS